MKIDKSEILPMTFVLIALVSIIILGLFKLNFLIRHPSCLYIECRQVIENK